MATNNITNTRNILLASAAAAAGAAAVYYFRNKEEHPPLEAAPFVDLRKYMGEWYEIARLPTPFEKQCYGTKAKYTLQEDGSVTVENSCHKGSLDGRLKKASGRATVAEPISNAKLKVQFLWPFAGDYWILEVGDGYEYALVGEPSRKNLWVLSRTPRLETSLLHNIVAKANRLGFDTSRLIYTMHR
jgi:apolipoprotein D and lipocalin family protein